MIGLSILVVFVLVTALTLWIFISVIKRAKRKGKNPYLHGGIATIILFFLITWDWIPSEIYYAYQCKQLPPMQVYKTPEQWVAENQDLIKGGKVEFKIKSEKDIPQISKEGYKLSFNTNITENRLFINATYRSDHFLRTYHTKETMIDRRTGELLVSDITFDQVVRFFSPPEIGGGKKCGSNNNEIKNETYFISLKEVNGFYDLQQNIKKRTLK